MCGLHIIDVEENEEKFYIIQLKSINTQYYYNYGKDNLFILALIIVRSDPRFIIMVCLVDRAIKLLGSMRQR